MTPDPAAPLGWTATALQAVGARRLGELYTSPGVFERERDSVFGRTWSLIAAAEDIDDGRCVTATVAGAPVVVWRDGSGRCRAFHNLCRHRGMPVVAGSGIAGRYITCPYHQWSFGLDGALTRIPQADQFPGIAAAAFGLRPVPVIEWRGMVFVCPGAETPDFDEMVAPLELRIGGHLGLDLTEVARAEYTVACNWKLLVENHIDVYHLWYLHQRSLAAYQHREFRWHWSGGTWWSWEPLKDPAAAGPGLPGLDEDARTGIGAHLLFPNLMIVTTNHYLATYDARPAEPGKTAVTLRVRSRPGPGLPDGPALVESIRSFFAEDVSACERLQLGVASPHYALGPLAADHEAPLGRFHERLRQQMGA